jgi:Fe2+ or Zn2+ uptake regulation protein
VRSPSELTETFRARGLKITPQRQLIFRILHGNEGHPSAESVYAAAVDQMPAISLRTVYQTLNDLSTMGEIQTRDLGTGAARFDPFVEEHHHHLVCEGCRAVVDVAVEGVEDLVPSGGMGGFAITSTELVFRGLCRHCQRAEPQRRAAPPAGRRPLSPPVTPNPRPTRRHVDG